MNIQINKERLENLKKAVKNTAKKLVIAGCIAGAMIVPATTVKAEAEQVNTNTGYYEISDDQTYAYIENLNQSDLEKICNVQTLDEIYVCSSEITSSSFIGSSASKLTLEDCDIKCDINLPSNISDFAVKRSQTKDYSFIKSNTTLENLYFEDCDFDTLKLIKNVSTKNLTFNCCNIGSTAGVDKINGLHNLAFFITGIEDTNEIAKCKDLEELTLSATCVKDLSPLEGTNLTYLDTSDSPIESFDSLKKMNKLDRLVTLNNDMAVSQDIIDYLNEKDIANEISEDSLKYQQQVKNIVKSIIKDDMNTNQKIRAIVDYVTDHITYDYDVETDEDLLSTYNVEGLKYALQGKGCCINYTALTTALLHEAKINVYDQRSDNHIWNIVKLDNKFYYIDTTYIDCSGMDISNYMSDGKNFANSGCELTMPSSLYNQINHVNHINTIQSSKSNQDYTSEQNQTKTQESSFTKTDESNKTSISNEEIANDVTEVLKSKNAGVAATVGILSALGMAGGVKLYIQKKKEKELENNNSKIQH